MNIYLAKQEGTDLYKVGITKKTPEERLKQLQTGNANKLILIETFQTKWDYKLETALHRHFKQKNVNSEWFELDEETVKKFSETCLKFETTFNSLKKSGNPFF